MSAPARFVVVGGGGFIGRHLVARLAARGASVRVVGLSGAGRRGTGDGADWVRCDVRDADGLRDAFQGMDVVYNLAAAHGIEGVTPAEFQDVNVAGAHSVCRAAAQAGTQRIIFTSSAAVYGHGRSPNEAAPADPRGSYGITKLAAEGVYRAWAAETEGRSLVIVRPTVVFGPGGEGTGGRLLRHVAGPRFAHVGRARNRKSLAYVENLAAFLAFAGDAPGRIETYNYADAPDLEVAEIAAIVRAAVGLPNARRQSMATAWASSVRHALVARLTRRPAPSLRAAQATERRLARDMRFNADKAHRSGFRQPVPLREALAATARADARWIALLSRARA